MRTVSLKPEVPEINHQANFNYKEIQKANDPAPTI